MLKWVHCYGTSSGYSLRCIPIYFALGPIPRKSYMERYENIEISMTYSSYAEFYNSHIKCGHKFHYQKLCGLLKCEHMYIFSSI